MNSEYQEHIVAFVDYLGFSAAIDSSDEASRATILRQLVSLAAMRGNFYVEKIDPKRTRLRAAISTFSDNIVISYSVPGLMAEGGRSRADALSLAIGQIAGTIGRHAYEALRNGFLIRGGLTVGNLYHANGVVFGEALVDAYRIESTTSIYPRVVISPSIVKEFAPTFKPWFLKDADGLTHLNYFSDVFAAFAIANKTPENEAQAKENWTYIATVVAENIRTLHSAGRINQMAKWRWLATQLHRFVERGEVPHAEALKSIRLPGLPI